MLTVIYIYRDSNLYHRCYRATLCPVSVRLSVRHVGALAAEDIIKLLSRPGSPSF